MCVGLSVIGVSYTMWRDLTYPMTPSTTSRGMSCGRTVRPPRRGHGLGHAASGDGGHVADNHRDRRAEAIGSAEVDREAGRHRRQAGHHEHVAVGQVVRRAFVQQAHGYSRLTDGHDGPLKATGFRRPSVTTGAGYGLRRVAAGRSRSWLGWVVRDDVAGQRFRRAAARCGTRGHRRGSARPRLGPQTARTRGLRRPDDPSGRCAA